MTSQEIDVLIIGGGSAGLCAGVWLARSGISFRILERRPGRLAHGQADGVQVRTVEIFESLGISEELLKEAYHVLEDAFWAPADDPNSENAGIRRTHSAPDTEAGLSHMPHVILNQARINGLLTDQIEKAAGHKENIEYGCEVQNVQIDTNLVDDPDAHCVTVTAVKDGVEQVYKAKYALAGDGAHSRARKALGIQMVGGSSDEIWGVMDVYPRTSFPDIRKKVIIKSNSGNIVLIPREGDALVRFYIELSTTDTPAKDITLPQLHHKAAQILHPYKLEIAETAWWSAYVIGQRLAADFHAYNRVFLAGDACHTHSPKAGQGMNVSLQDGFNIGWKLASVLRGRTEERGKGELLETYVLEREATARDLIEFDRYWSRLFSTSEKNKRQTSDGEEDGAQASEDIGDENGEEGAAAGGITPELFIKAGRYTAGLVTRYADSIITSASTSQAAPLAKNLTVGMRFPSAQVVRVCDARHMPLTRALLADSLRWNLVIFGGEEDVSSSKRIQKLASDLRKAVRAFTPSEDNPDSVFNVVLVLSSKRADVDIEAVPEVFTPVTGKWKMKNILNVFVDDEGYNNSGHGRAYEAYGIDLSQGALVIVRPDQYISRIGSLEDIEGVNSFFSGFLKRWNV